MIDNQPMFPEHSADLELRQAALAAWREPDPEVKVEFAHVLYIKFAMYSIANGIFLNVDAPSSAHPGHPNRPTLTHPAKVPRRSPLTLEGRAAMVHAICHIEFNAIKNAGHSFSSRIAQ